MTDEVLAEAVPTLRRELAEPNLAFKGRRERIRDQWYEDSDIEQKPDVDLGGLSETLQYGLLRIPV